MNILHFTLLPSSSWVKSIHCQEKDGWTLAASDSCSKSRPTLRVLVVSSQNSDYSCLTSLSFLPHRVQVFLKTPCLSSILIWWQSPWEDPLHVLWTAVTMALDDLIMQPPGCLGDSWLGSVYNLWLWNRAKLTGVEPWPSLSGGMNSVDCTNWPHSWQGYYVRALILVGFAFIEHWLCQALAGCLYREYLLWSSLHFSLCYLQRMRVHS